jgi:hypothetical protein
MAKIVNQTEDLHHDAQLTIDDAAMFMGAIELVQVIRANKGDPMTCQMVDSSVGKGNAMNPSAVINS